MLSSVAVLGKVAYIPGEPRLVEHKLCASECTVYSLQDTSVLPRYQRDECIIRLLTALFQFHLLLQQVNRYNLQRLIKVVAIGAGYFFNLKNKH